MWVLPVAALGSVTLHAILLLPLVLGASAKMRTPNSFGAGASAIVSSAEPTMTVVFIDAPAVTSDPGRITEDISSRGLPSEAFAMKVVSPDPTPAFDIRSLTTDRDAPDPIPEAAGDIPGHALMFGRYMGQVMARIERAWLRPRSPISDPLFRCRVEIKQSAKGDVLEVTMQQCNGDGHWQASLAAAIQTASPLPAPPDPSVFADTLTLTFDAEPFRAGGNGEGFEPQPSQIAGTFSLGPATSEILHRTPGRGAIELRITGVRDESLAAPQPGTREAEYPNEPSPALTQ